MYCSGARLVLSRLRSLIFYFSASRNVMPIAMEYSMFCCGRLISSAGFNFIKFVGVSDLLIMETICSKISTCACFLCHLGNENCFCI